MTKKLLMSRRAFALKGAALGLATLTPLIVPGIPTSSRQAALLGHFQNADGTGH